jgi:hypothetical protein
MENELQALEYCPKCETELKNAPGLGLYCPNSTCDVLDGILLYKKEYVKRMVDIGDCV